MPFSTWKERHFLPPYDEVSRRKEKIKWCRRVILWIALIIIMFFVIRSYIKKEPVKVSIESYEHKAFHLPRTTFCFNGNLEFSQLFVLLYNSSNTLLNRFQYNVNSSSCTVGEKLEACTTPLFQLNTIPNVPSPHCLSIVESEEWVLNNYEGYAFVFGYGVQAQEPYGQEYYSEIVDLYFDVVHCPSGVHHCESMTTSSVISSHGFSEITLSQDTVVDKKDKYIISYPFTMGSVALSDYYLNSALTDLGETPRDNDTVFIASINSNAKIVTKTYLERPHQTAVRIIESVLGIFGGVVIIGELLMTLFNHCFFTGTDTIDHEMRDSSLYLVREQIQQHHLKPPGTEINMMPAGSIGGPPVAFRN